MSSQTPSTIPPVTPPTSASAPRALQAFESVPFRWLIGSLLTFFLAMQGQIMVRSLLAWDLTQSELSLAYVNLCIAIPMVVGSFVAGAVIDRVERRTLVVVTQSIALLNELLVLFLLLTGNLTYTHLLITSFIIGVMFPFISPTRTAMIAPLVGRRLLGNAMALQSASMNVARILGPSMVGILIPFVSIKGAYVAAISMHVISISMMFWVPRCMPDQSVKKSLLKDVTYSFTYVAKHREILLTLLFGLFPMLLALPILSFLVVFTEEVWLVGETGLGLLTATVGVGGIVGSMLVAKMGTSIPQAKMMIAGAILFAAILAAFCQTPIFAIALVLLLVANIFSNISQTLNQTIVQVLAHEEVRGRMSSLVMLSLGLTPLGVLPIALFAERFGIAATMTAACVILFSIVMAFLIFSPTLRKMDVMLKERHRLDAEADAKEYGS